MRASGLEPVEDRDVRVSETASYSRLLVPPQRLRSARGHLDGVIHMPRRTVTGLMSCRRSKPWRVLSNAVVGPFWRTTCEPAW